MKALEELLGEFCNGQPLEADVGLRIAAAIREYNRECNTHLRDAVFEAVETCDPDDSSATITDIVLAALPPQNVTCKVCGGTGKL